MTEERPEGDRIEIRDLRVVGVHGVLPEERERAQPFSLDIVAWVDMAAAQCERVTRWPIRSTYEAPWPRRRPTWWRSVPSNCSKPWPGRLADALLVTDPRLRAVEVTVRKLRPPLALDLASTGVRLLRSGKAAARHARRTV